MKRTYSLTQASGALLGGVLLLAALLFVWWAFAEDGSAVTDSVLGTTPTQAVNSNPPASDDSQESDPTNEIVVGMSGPFSGPSRSLGIELYRGSMAYFDSINGKGGVHGRKIVIKAYDDGYNPIPAIANTVRLIEKDHVFLLFDYVGTPTTTRCLPLLKLHRDQSMFLFFPFTGAEPQRQPPYGEFVFNFRPSYYQETGGLVEHFFEIGRKKIGVFYQIDAYGRNGWEGVRAALRGTIRKWWAKPPIAAAPPSTKVSRGRWRSSAARTPTSSFPLVPTPPAPALSETPETPAGTFPSLMFLSSAVKNYWNCCKTPAKRKEPTTHRALSIRK